jgi:hypothetical protein
MVEHIDMDVARNAHAHGGAEKDDDDQRVDGDLLGPGKAVVQRIAREELQEDTDDHAPEHGERDPVLDAVVRQVNVYRHLFEGVGDLFDGDLGMVFLGHRRGLPKLVGCQGLERPSGATWGRTNGQVKAANPVAALSHCLSI